ncbi:MAG: CHAP domain-containing protein [Ruminococcaceae bacterium]|nr:CHAP domain-containing protein [Oscillospiraceae bacterium]
MKKTLIRVFSLVLVMSMLLSCIPFTASAAEYKVAYKNGASSSYKSSKYYQNFQKIQLTGDGRTDTVALALSQMGYHEGSSTSDLSGSSSSNGNYTEYNWNLGSFMTGGYNYEWCATFCSWALFQAGQVPHGTGTKDLCRYHKGEANYIWREVGCSPWVYNLQKAGRWKYSKYYGGSYTPQPGDLIFFRSAAHIGMVVYADSSYVYTIEGNTSDAQGVEPAGGGVFFKSYSLSSSSIDGYGALPYKTNASANKVDYSGANPTPGYWMTNAKKYIYSDAACTVDTGTRIPRFTMIEATAVAPSRKAIKVTYNGVTGYVALNSDRVVQLTSSSTIDPAVQAARDKLQTLVNTVSGISYRDYTDDRLTTLRAKYYDAQVVLSNEDSTVAQYDNAYNALNTAYNNKSANPARGVYITGVNTRVTNGQAVLFTSKFGTITAENASHRWTANMRAKWDDRANGYVVVGVETGIGDETPPITLANDEIFIAVHNWETDVPASESPVPGSEQNYLNSWIPEYGGYKINFNGVNIENGILDIGAYISFEEVDSNVTVDGNIVYKKGYTTRGLYAENGAVLWPDENGVTLTNGFLPLNTAGFDDPGFAGFNANSEEYIADGFASITVDLGGNFEINRMMAHVATKYNSSAGIYAPSVVEFYVSADGSYWHKAGEVTPVDDASVSTMPVTLELSEPVYGKYIQYRFKTNNSWIFVSEVEAYGTESDYDPGYGETDIQKGDIDGNGSINSMDYVMLRRAFFGIFGLSSEAVGDIDGNGSINSMDYVMLRRVFFGIYSL